MRKVLFPTVIFIATILIVARIFYLQIIDDSFKLASDNNAIKIKYDYPERGYIYDRYGKLLVANQPSYDIMVIPKDIKELDTTEFCSLLNITKEDFLKKIWFENDDFEQFFPNLNDSAEPVGFLFSSVDPDFNGQYLKGVVYDGQPGGLKYDFKLRSPGASPLEISVNSVPGGPDKFYIERYYPSITPA